MLSKKVVVTTILGLGMGLWGYFGGSWCGVQFTLGQMLTLVFTEMLMGFVIGISAWKINYLLHGLLIGLIVNFPMSLGAIDFDVNSIYVLIGLGCGWGVFIEWLADILLSDTKRFNLLNWFYRWNG
jgi:hypothetical protein